MRQEEIADDLIIENVDISHLRLVELVRLADQAKPFYVWAEQTFQAQLNSQATFSEILLIADKIDIERCLRNCYFPAPSVNVPILFDGVGRSYPHQKGCYYFFSWLVRDAPKQRLEPLIQRIVRTSKQKRIDVEIVAIAALICKYRSVLGAFSWDAMREVVIDRLEGSRRSIVGHERETVVRTALLTAFQSYFAAYSGYGIYATIEISAGQIRIGAETYDVSALLKDENNQVARRILVPVKTRETEGGGHSHLFTRDISAAINAARTHSPDDFVVAVIVARNWSVREADRVKDSVDYAAVFDISPNEFRVFSEREQTQLNAFIASVLDGTITPKTL